MILTHGSNSISREESILPEGYQQLKYIHFKGTTSSYLYTAYGVSNSYKIELKGKLHSFTSYGGLLFISSDCSIIAPSSSQYIKVRNTNLPHLGYQDTYDKSILLDDFTMVLDKTQFTVNNESPIELWHYASTAGQLTISSAANASNNFDLYSIKFINTNDGTTTLHFIPCKEISTGRYGLYEIVFNGFTPGANVAP